MGRRSESGVWSQVGITVPENGEETGEHVLYVHPAGDQLLSLRYEMSPNRFMWQRLGTQLAEPSNKKGLNHEVSDFISLLRCELIHNLTASLASSRKRSLVRGSRYWRCPLEAILSWLLPSAPSSFWWPCPALQCPLSVMLSWLLTRARWLKPAGRGSNLQNHEPKWFFFLKLIFSSICLSNNNNKNLTYSSPFFKMLFTCDSDILS